MEILTAPQLHSPWILSSILEVMMEAAELFKSPERFL